MHATEASPTAAPTPADLHHYAWRAQKANQTVFTDPRLERQFGGWNTSQCQEPACVEAHTMVDVVVDVQALQRLIAGRLELIRAGASVARARLPWPPAR